MFTPISFFINTKDLLEPSELPRYITADWVSYIYTSPKIIKHFAHGSLSMFDAGLHTVFFIRINIFQASLKVILNFKKSKPVKIPR